MKKLKQTDQQVKPAEQLAEDKPVVPEKTAAEQIWLRIKDTRLEMFGLPSQTIASYCSPVLVDPKKLYVSYKIGAVLPAMEAALSGKYEVELLEKFITIVPAKGTK